MRHESATTLLFQGVTQATLDAIAASEWLAFPPLPVGQSFFCPALHAAAAAALPAEQDGSAAGTGYVLRFAVEADYADSFPVRQPEYQQYPVLWVPAAELPEFNRHIVGRMEVVGVFDAH